MLTVLIPGLEIWLVYMMVCLLRKEWVEEKGMDLSLAYAPYPYYILCQDESRKGICGFVIILLLLIFLIDSFEKLISYQYHQVNN